MSIFKQAMIVHECSSHPEPAHRLNLTLDILSGSMKLKTTSRLPAGLRSLLALT